MNSSIFMVADLFFLSAAAGLLAGYALRRFQILPETAAGAVISLIFFCMLPEALTLAGGAVVFPALALGMIFAVFLKDILQTRRPAVFFASCLGLYGFPCGMALAGGLLAGAAVSVKFALAVSILYLPWGAVFEPRRLRLVLAATLPVLAGALVGVGAAHISYKLIGLLLAAGCGVMLYAALGPALPRSRMGYGMMTGILIGFVAAIL